MDIDREIGLDGVEKARGRGRPRRIKGGGVRFDACIGPEHRDMMDEMSAKSGFSKSDLLRRMIEMHYNMNRDRWGLGDFD